MGGRELGKERGERVDRGPEGGRVRVGGRGREGGREGDLYHTTHINS